MGLNFPQSVVNKGTAGEGTAGTYTKGPCRMLQETLSRLHAILSLLLSASGCLASLVTSNYSSHLQLMPLLKAGTRGKVPFALAFCVSSCSSDLSNCLYAAPAIHGLLHGCSQGLTCKPLILLRQKVSSSLDSGSALTQCLGG